METERKHIFIRKGDYDAVRRLEPDHSFSAVVRELIIQFVDKRIDKLPKEPKPSVEL